MTSGIRSWLTRQLPSINRSTVVSRLPARSSRLTPLGTTYCCQPLGGGQLVGMISVCVGMGVVVNVAVVFESNPDNIVGLGDSGEMALGRKVLVGKIRVGNKATGCPCASDRVIPPITIMIDARVVSIPTRSSRKAFMRVVSGGRFALHRVARR